jgi:hypothetical protein
LGGFLNASAEWADTFVPIHRAKIIISGTDSFLLWLAQSTSLFHRYVPFQANWVSYPEWRRVIGQSFDDYKTGGGIFTAESMADYIRTALAENLIHSLEHYFDDANRTNEYTSRLYGIDEAVIYKAIISILKCAVDADVKRNFIQNADEKTIVELGTAISEWSAAEKRDIKERVAEALDVYKDFEGIKNPKAAIEALVQFLVKIGCLTETVFGISEYRDSATAYTFAHNALMNYSLQETIHGILKLENIDHSEFDAAIRQAAAGTINESIVFAHVLKGAGKGDKVFKYRDLDNREIDIVSINREAKTLWLIEVRSKSSVNPASVFHNEAKNLFNPEILKNMGADNSFRVVRVLVYGGKSNPIVTKERTLLCTNIEEFLAHFKDLEQYLGKFSARAKEIYDSKYPRTLLEEVREEAQRIHDEYVPPHNTKGRNGRDIDD